MGKEHFPTDPVALSRAKRMRSEAAPAEKKLWAQLRNRNVDGFKFRRQVPMPPYILDFYCDECRLVVELDGDSHAEREAEDARRTSWLEGMGLRVVRFDNPKVFDAIDAVVNEIERVCRERVDEIARKAR